MKVWLSNWHCGPVEGFFPNRVLTPIPGSRAYSTEVKDNDDLMALVRECPHKKCIIQFLDENRSEPDTYDVAVYFTPL